MVAPLLELRKITKRFPGALALSEVSLEIFPGEIVALIGENGAGKSTLLKTLGGVHRPDEGTIQIDGEPVTICSVNDAMRHGIGFIHQELNVLDNVDVAGNIFLGREPLTGGPLRLIDRRRIHAEAAKYLQRLGMDIPTDVLVGSLPIAYQQMIEIAKALSLNTRILLMDEPTSSLTLSETEKLLKVTLDLRAEGVSIIYISHRLSEVKRIADRVVALRDGKNAGSLAREEITHERMVKLMVGRDLAYRQPSPAARGEVCLEVRGLRTRRYPAQSVSFDLRRGEIVGFRGPGGGGTVRGGASDLRGGWGDRRHDSHRWKNIAARCAAGSDRGGDLPDPRRPAEDRFDYLLAGAGKHHAALAGGAMRGRV